MTASWRRIWSSGRWCRVREWLVPVDEIDVWLVPVDGIDVWRMASLLTNTYGAGAANDAL